MSKTRKEDKKPEKTQSTKLVELAANARIFHDSERIGFVIVSKNSHEETYRIRSKDFRNWLAESYFRENGSVPGSQAMQDAIGTIEGQAQFNGSQERVNLRISGDDGRIVIDLGNPNWDRVVVDKTGWRIEDFSSEIFVRSRGMQALPYPRKSSDGLALLKSILNVSDVEMPLLLGWMLGALRPSGPFPLLAIHGEQGSAKSTTSKLCRRLIDPNKADLRSSPREERDLVIAASNGWVLALENLSSVPVWLSDALCRLATGAGFSTRELYSDSDEVIFEACRPILLNGIEELANRSDLIDRCIFLNLPTIPKSKRRTERELWKAFDACKAQIFGWLLDAVVSAIKNLGTFQLSDLPRMADFAEWVVAGETGLGFDGEFLRAYNGNRETANESAIESNPIGKPIISLLDSQNEFLGNSSELLVVLNELVSDQQKKSKEWPKSARALSGKLRRIAPNLRQAGYSIETGLPNRQIRLQGVSTVSTVDTVASMDGNDGSNGQLCTHS